jgi:hypothetical protein
VNEIFADTNYFNALQLPRDSLHSIAVHLTLQFTPTTRIVTSDLVLSEYLAHFSSSDAFTKRQAVKTWRELHAAPKIIVIQAIPELLDRSAKLYEQAPTNIGASPISLRSLS